MSVHRVRTNNPIDRLSEYLGSLPLSPTVDCTITTFASPVCDVIEDDIFAKKKNLECHWYKKITVKNWTQKKNRKFSKFVLAIFNVTYVAFSDIFYIFPVILIITLLK